MKAGTGPYWSMRVSISCMACMEGVRTHDLSVSRTEMASDVSLSLSLWFPAGVSDCACTSEPDISAIVASTVASASKDGSRVLRNCWIAAIVVAVVAVTVCAVCVRRRLLCPSLLFSSVVTFVSFRFAFPLSLADYFAEPENGGSAAVTIRCLVFGIWYLARDTNTNTGDTGGSSCSGSLCLCVLL